jgi:hypothetical protein
VLNDLLVGSGSRPAVRVVAAEQVGARVGLDGAALPAAGRRRRRQHRPLGGADPFDELEQVVQSCHGYSPSLRHRISRDTAGHRPCSDSTAATSDVPRGDIGVTATGCQQMW